MPITDRSERITSELDSLLRLQQASTIFSFSTEGEPVERLRLVFRGRGLEPDRNSNAKPMLLMEHQIELRLPYGFPQSPPDVRWLTPIVHPNVSFSGLLNLRDVGFEWTDDTGLDLVCERLWDMIRLAEVRSETAVNPSARRWLEHQTDFTLPLDPRPLRDVAAGRNRNVVKYRRRGTTEQAAAIVDEEVFYIGEDTLPELPPAVGPRCIARTDSEVFYIGDDER